MFRHFLIARTLFNTAADDGAGGGGGGGAGGGFSDAQVTSIKNIVSSVVNATITARDKQADKKRAEDLQKVTDGFTQKLTEALEGFKGAGGGGGDDGKNGGGGDGKGSSKKDVEISTLRQELASIKTKQQESEARAKQANDRIRATNLRASVAEVLQKAGIDGRNLKGAFALLAQEGRLRYADDESEDIVFVDDSGAEVEYAAGLSQWLKGDDAKMFLPAVGAGGSGSSRPRTQQGAGDTSAPTDTTGRMKLVAGALKDALDDLR